VEVSISHLGTSWRGVVKFTLRVFLTHPDENFSACSSGGGGRCILNTPVGIDPLLSSKCVRPETDIVIAGTSILSLTFLSWLLSAHFLQLPSWRGHCRSVCMKALRVSCLFYGFCHDGVTPSVLVLLWSPFIRTVNRGDSVISLYISPPTHIVDIKSQIRDSKRDSHTFTFEYNVRKPVG
jgi:hypothetical protein